MGFGALAGIVVNNNIVDRYPADCARGHAPAQAALEAGCLRLRDATHHDYDRTGVDADGVRRQRQFVCPALVSFSRLPCGEHRVSAIADELTFATFLALLLTPCMLVIGGRLRREKDLTWLKTSYRDLWEANSLGDCLGRHWCLSSRQSSLHNTGQGAYEDRGLSGNLICWGLWAA